MKKEREKLAEIAIKILDDAFYFQEEPLKGVERFTDADTSFCMNWGSIHPDRVNEYKRAKIKYLCNS